MTDLSVAIRRRRWEWCAVIGVILATLTIATWFLLREPPEVEKARAVRLGMDRKEVREILGKEQALNERHVLYGSLHSQILKLRFRFGDKIWFLKKLNSKYDNWPVHIRFDSDGRVNRIKRGSEIVER